LINIATRSDRIEAEYPLRSEKIMKVFISWSGPLGKALAEAIRQWLPAVIQVVRPYYTPDDIAKGARWSAEIAKELEESQVGIICVTRDSLAAPWISFEAGALSKNIDKSRVCPILFDLKPSDVQGPLVQFQLTQFEEKEIKKVVKMINEILMTTKPEGALDIAVLDSVFEMWWPKLKEKVDAILQQPPQKGKAVMRPDRELLEEILRLTRVGASGNSPSITREPFHPGRLSEIIQGFYSLVKECNSLGMIEPLTPALARLSESLHDLFSRKRDFGLIDEEAHDTLHMAMDLLKGRPERKRKKRPAFSEKEVLVVQEDRETIANLESTESSEQSNKT
jgi:hypothetical protein